MNKVAAFDPYRFVAPEPPPAPAKPSPIPKTWAHGLQLLAERPLPPCADPSRWRQILADAGRICADWLAPVLAAGWPLESLFGIDLRDGRESLAVAARGRSLAYIDADEAALLIAGGKFFLRPRLGVGTPLLWDFNHRDIEQ